MMVLNALDDTYPKSADWDTDTNVMTVLVYVDDKQTVPEQLLQEYRRRAQVVMGPSVTVVVKVQEGIPVPA